MGIGSGLLEYALPSGSVKKGFGLLTGLVMTLAVISPFVGDGFRLSFDELDISYDESYYSDKIIGETQDIILSDAKKQIEEYFLDKLNKNGLEARKIDISLKINSQNEIEITEVEIKGAKAEDKEKAADLVSEELEQTEISVITEESDESES